MSVCSGVGIIVPSGLIQLNVVQNLMKDRVAEVYEAHVDEASVLWR